MTTPIDLSSSFRLDDRVVLITGASSGLGARFARVAAAAGARVALIARRIDRLDALVAELPDAVAFPTDLTAAGSPEAMVEDVLSHFGTVDVLVNNAGFSQIAPALELDGDAFRREIELDLIVPYIVARGVAAAAIEAGRPASIINIGSVLGSGGGGKMRAPGYAAAKGGLHNLTRELASEWARKDIRVNAIAPGFFDTEMTAEMLADEAGDRYVREGAPMARAGRVDELDGALLFLAGDSSSFVTGQIIHVDGGWTAI